MNDATGRPWSLAEVEATVADYFHMLRLELLGQTYNKSAHNRILQEKLSGRSSSSVEMKHRNISAVLIDLGVMPIRGYKSLPNYQRLLAEVVASRLSSDTALDQAALAVVEQPAELPVEFNFESFVVPRPAITAAGIGDERQEWLRQTPVKRDYLERESRNRALGLSGELLVVEYEVRRLHGLGEKKLADRVEHVSATRGDGAGYDIQSYEPGGRERFIEVKTTAFNASTPFYMSKNEVEFSKHFSSHFQLYRLFDFRNSPQMFPLVGAIETSCVLDPINFRASLL